MSSAPLDIFRRLTNGVYVIGVRHGDEQNAFTAAWLSQVSFDPLMVGLSINPGHASFPLLIGAGAFAVSILTSDGVEAARHFGTQSGRDHNKLDSQRWSMSPRGMPVLDSAVAQFDCKLTAQHPAGDHVIVVARVVDGRLLRGDAKPLIYADTGNLDGSATLYPERF